VVLQQSLCVEETPWPAMTSGKNWITNENDV